MEADNTFLHSKLKDANKKLEQAKQYSRKENLIVTGIAPIFAKIAEESHRSVEYFSETVDKVVGICRNVLDVNISNKDIFIAHRMKIRNTVGCAPILVRFSPKIA